MIRNILFVLGVYLGIFCNQKAFSQILIGQSQPVYKTLGNVAAFYNSTPLTENLVFEVQEDYQPSAETYPITFNQNTGDFSVTIQKKSGNFSILNSAPATNGLVVFNGAHKLTLQNHPDASGSWTFQNLAPDAATVLLLNNASNNTIRGLKIEGRTTNLGLISIVNASAGNNGNRIENNEIRPYSGNQRSITIKRVANFPDKVDIWQTKISNTTCTQQGANAAIQVTTRFPHNMAAGVPVKIDKMCGITLANGNHTISEVQNENTFTIVTAGTCPTIGHNISLMEPLNVIRDLVVRPGNIKIFLQYPPDFATGEKVKINDIRGVTDGNGIYVVDSVNLVEKSFVINKSTSQTNPVYTYVMPRAPRNFSFLTFNTGTATRVRFSDGIHGFTNIPGQKIRFTGVTVPFGPDPDHYNNQIFDVNYIDSISFWISKPYQDAITVSANMIYEVGGLKGKKFMVTEIYRSSYGQTIVMAEPHGFGAQSTIDLYNSGHPSQNAITGLFSTTANRLNPYAVTIGGTQALNKKAATVQKLDFTTEKPIYKFVNDGIGYEPVSALGLPSLSLNTVEPNAVQISQPFVLSGAFNVDDRHATFDINGGEHDFNGYHTSYPLGPNRLVLTGKTAKGNYCPAHLSAPLVVTTAGPHGLGTGSQLVISDETDISGLNGKKTVTVLNDSVFYINGSVGQFYKMERGSDLGTYRQYRINKGGYNNNGTNFLGSLYDIGDRVHTKEVGVNYSGFSWTSGDSVEVEGAILKYLWPKRKKWFVSSYHVQGLFFHGSRVAVAEYSGKAKAVVAPAEIEHGIYARSNTGQSSGNILSGNKIANARNTGIYIGSTGNGNGWEIKDNHIFRMAMAFETNAGIQVLSGSGHTITGNFIGGSEPFAGGKPLKLSKDVTRDFTGIRLSTGTGTQTVLARNSILNTHNFNSNITGIEVLGGNVRIGGALSTEANLIGGAKDLTTIENFVEKIKTFDSTFHKKENGELYGKRIFGIVLKGNANSEIWNNQIKNGSFTMAYRGIGVESSGNTSIRGNVISRNVGMMLNIYVDRNSSLPGIYETGGSDGETIEAIYVNSGNKQIEISGNEISKFLNTTTADIRLVYIVNNPGNSGGTFTNNRIYSHILTQFANNRNLPFGRADYVTFLENAEDTDGSSKWTVTNNMFTSYGGEGRSDTHFSLIRHSGANGSNPHEYYHNTLFISGGIGNGFSDNEQNNSISFFKAGNTAAKLRNNLFVNTRGMYNNTDNTFSRHVVFGLPNRTGFDSDYNVFSLGKHYSVYLEGVVCPFTRFVAGIGSNATSATSLFPISLDSLQGLTNGDRNSIQSQPSWEVEPQLFSAHINKDIEGNLRLSPNNVFLSKKGVNVGVSTDLYGTTRNATPDIGAHEFSANPEIENNCYWTGAKNESWFDAENWLNNQVPDSTKSAVVSNEPFKPHMPHIINGIASVKDLIITAEGGSNVHLRRNAELKIFGNATGWKDSSFIQSGGLLTFAKRGGEQIFSSLRRGEIVRGPIWGVQNFYVGYDFFYVKSRVKSAISTTTVTAGSITFNTVSVHGLKSKEEIVLSGFTGDLASLNGKSFAVSVTGTNSFSVSNPGINAQTSNSPASYTFLRSKVDISTTNCQAGVCTLTTKAPHGFYRDRMIFISTGNTSSNVLKSFVLVDSVLSELSFTVKRSNGGSFIDNSGSASAYAFCTGYGDIKIAGGGIKRPEGIYEICGKLNLENGILISDMNERNQSLVASAHQTWNIQPVKMMVLKKFSTASGTTYPSFTGGNDSSYVEGEIAAQMGKQDMTPQWFPLGYDGKFRPAKLSFSTGPSNVNFQYFMVARWKKMEESKLPGLALDQSSLNEKLTRVMSKSYLDVTPYAYDLAMFPNAFYGGYTTSTMAVYLLNLFMTISYADVNISNMQVGLSFKPEDFDVPAFKYKDLRVSSEKGLPESGYGFSASYQPYRPNMIRNAGLVGGTLDSTSALKYIQGTYGPQAFNWMITTTDVNLVSVEPGISTDLKMPKNGILAFPNPNTGDFEINATTEIEGVEIYDFMGRKMYENQAASGKFINIERGAWKPKPGMYLLQVKRNKKMTTTKILVK